MNINLLKIAISLYLVKILICIIFYTKLFYDIETKYKTLFPEGIKAYFIYALEDRSVIGILYMFLFWITMFPSIILSIIIIKIIKLIKKG